MKNTVALIVLGMLLFICAGCSKDPPELRVRNNNAEKVNVSIKPDAGNTININDVQPGAFSLYSVVPEGSGTISASRSGTSPEDIRYSAKKGETYLVILSPGNTPTLSFGAE